MVQDQITDAITETPPVSNISMADIAFMVQIIEVCSQRGAFRAEEMTTVGNVYERVKAFVIANAPKPTEEAPTETGESK